MILSARRRYPSGRSHAGNTRDERAFRISPPHGCHSDPRRAAAQPPERLVRPAAQQAHRDHRRVRLGEILARLRHHLRRGAAALRRVALGLRPAVPRADGEAGRGLHRGPLPGDLDRAADHLAQPPLDGGHGHRDLRLPASSLRVGREAALSQVRPADPGPDHPGDGRPRAAPAGRQQVPGPRPVRLGQEGRVQEADGRDGQGGLSPGPRRREVRGPRRPARARQAEEAHDRDRRRPSGRRSPARTRSTASAWPIRSRRRRGCPGD